MESVGGEAVMLLDSALFYQLNRGRRFEYGGEVEATQWFFFRKVRQQRGHIQIKPEGIVSLGCSGSPYHRVLL